MDKNNNW